MKYALGNMLNGAGGLNPDGLALDLQFAADKTLTARRGPTPVLTRSQVSSTGSTYVGSDGLIKYAAANEPRFDHDPVSPFACRGLLIEEQRQNLVIQSEGFSTGSWTKSGSTVTADSIASPDGAVTADLLVEDSGLSTHVVQQGVPSLTAGQPYTLSVFAKAASHTSFQLVPSVTAFGSGLFANFVLTGSGSVGTSSGVTASIQSYPNGWYRCSITVASVSGGAGGFFVIAANNNNSSATRVPSYQGTGAQVVHLWGAQLEAGSFPTSYIPTTTSALTRSADVCSITGADFTNLWNTSEGTMFINSTRTQPTGINFQPFFSANDGTNNNRVLIGNFGNPNDIEFNISTLGATEYNGNINNATTLIRRVALAYRGNSTNRSYNGNIGTDDTSSQLPTVNRAQFGNSQVIAAIRYYKKRLPNAKLQALTV